MRKPMAAGRGAASTGAHPAGCRGCVACMTADTHEGHSGGKRAPGSGAPHGRRACDQAPGRAPCLRLEAPECESTTGKHATGSTRTHASPEARSICSTSTPNHHPGPLLKYRSCDSLGMLRWDRHGVWVHYTKAPNDPGTSPLHKHEALVCEAPRASTPRVALAHMPRLWRVFKCLWPCLGLC